MSWLERLPCWKGQYAKGNNPSIDPPPSVQGKWSILHSPGYPEEPTMISPPDVLHVDFIASPDQSAHIHYMTKKIGPMSISGKIALAFHMAWENGTEFFQVGNEPGNAPNFRLLVQRYGDDLRSTSPFHRIWSGTFWPMADERKTGLLEQELVASQWTNVIGQVCDANPAEFAATLAEAENVGVTFGGGIDHGHGAGITRGAARLTVTGLAVG